MRLSFLIFLLLLTSLAFSQNSTVAPVPAGPYELAAGSIKVLDETDQRAAVLGLIERARQNSDLHAPGGHPLVLKVSFEASGNVSQTGSGQMEETWFKPALWRWTGNLGSYTQTRMMDDRRMYDENPSLLPLRLQMVRGTIFWPIHMRSNELMRIAAGTWKGSPVMCVLGSLPMSNAANVAGRSWEESEFCIDTKTGLLQTYSVAPGIYAVYDYQDAVQFHASILPKTISMYEAGSVVLTIHLDSITDAGQSDPKLFTPTAKMAAQGTGPVIAGPYRFAVMGGPSPVPMNGTIQPVVVHALLNTSGKVEEAEALQTSDPNLSSAAVALVKNSPYAAQEQGRALQREAFISVRFMPTATLQGQ